MNWKECEIELLTPCFCAGAEQDSPEIRVPSIRGQLRSWFRVLYGCGKPEWELWGGIKGKRFGFEGDAIASRVLLRVKARNGRTEQRVSLCPHDVQKGHRGALLEAQFTLSYRFRLNGATPKSSLPAEFETTLRAWLLLGGLGARRNRAAGSVWRAGFHPSSEDFYAEVESLAMPKAVRVAVLNRVDDPEELRKLATNTLAGNSGTVIGETLGFVRGRERKGSPLKLKVGRFKDGHRLIAVWDDREPCGDIRTASEQLRNAQKPIGELLCEAFPETAGIVIMDAC